MFAGGNQQNEIKQSSAVFYSATPSNGRTKYYSLESIFSFFSPYPANVNHPEFMCCFISCIVSNR